MAKSRTKGWKWEKGLAYGKGRKHTGELVWELQDAAQASKIFGCSIQILVSPDTRPWTVEASSQRTWQARDNIWRIAGTLQMMQISRPCHVCFSSFKTIVRPFCALHITSLQATTKTLNGLHVLTKTQPSKFILFPGPWIKRFYKKTFFPTDPSHPIPTLWSSSKTFSIHASIMPTVSALFSLEACCNCFCFHFWHISLGQRQAKIGKTGPDSTRVNMSKRCNKTNKIPQSLMRKHVPNTLRKSAPEKLRNSKNLSELHDFRLQIVTRTGPAVEE